MSVCQVSPSLSILYIREYNLSLDDRLTRMVQCEGFQLRHRSAQEDLVRYPQRSDKAGSEASGGEVQLISARGAALEPQSSLAPVETGSPIGTLGTRGNAAMLSFESASRDDGSGGKIRGSAWKLLHQSRYRCLIWSRRPDLPRGESMVRSTQSGEGVEVTIAAGGYLKLLELRSVFVQDSVLLRKQFPSHFVFQHPIFSTLMSLSVKFYGFKRAWRSTLIKWRARANCCRKRPSMY